MRNVARISWALSLGCGLSLLGCQVVSGLDELEVTTSGAGGGGAGGGSTTSSQSSSSTQVTTGATCPEPIVKSCVATQCTDNQCSPEGDACLVNCTNAGPETPVCGNAPMGKDLPCLGPGGGASACKVICDNTECADRDIRCPPSGPCEVFCNANGACLNARIHCPAQDAGAFCTVHCAPGGCDDTTIVECGPGACITQCPPASAPTEHANQSCMTNFCK